MRWNVERSLEIKECIVKNRKLMETLSTSVDETLKKHGVKLGGMSYVFEPRVFKMDPEEAGGIIIEGPKAFAVAALSDASIIDMQMAMDLAKSKCLPYCGPMDRFSLDIFERLRISDKVVADDPVPIRESSDLMMSIAGDRQLIEDLSHCIFGMLAEHGIELGEGEGCVFAPSVFRKPIYAQRVGEVSELKQFGFGPQVFADPHPEPSTPEPVPWRGPLPGIIRIRDWDIDTIAVLDIPERMRIRVKWWIGIPAPDVLHALDVMM